MVLIFVVYSMCIYIYGSHGSHIVLMVLTYVVTGKNTSLSIPAISTYLLYLKFYTRLPPKLAYFLKYGNLKCNDNNS